MVELPGIELASENTVDSRLLELLLGAVFRLDVRTAPLIHPPFGVSALILAQRF